VLFDEATDDVPVLGPRLQIREQLDVPLAGGPGLRCTGGEHGPHRLCSIGEMVEDHHPYAVVRGRLQGVQRCADCGEHGFGVGKQFLHERGDGVVIARVTRLAGRLQAGEAALRVVQGVECTLAAQVDDGEAPVPGKPGRPHSAPPWSWRDGVHRVSGMWALRLSSSWAERVTKPASVLDVFPVRTGLMEKLPQ
jgi:hypothetical protein